VGTGDGLHQPRAGVIDRHRTGDEQELSGTAGSQFLSRIEQIISGQPPRGSNVLLTLDPAIQARVRRARLVQGPSSRSIRRPGASSRW
jgi:hypothetical protein